MPETAAPAQQRLTGTITDVSKKKDWGFVRYGERKDAFVHVRDFDGAVSLKVGNKLEFDLAYDEGRKNPRAINVKVVG